MSFQKAAGWRLRVDSNRRASRKEVTVGELGKRFTGRPSKDHRAHEGQMSEDLVFEDPCCADTLEGVLLGEGYYFPFIEDAWAVNSGLGPELGSAWTLISGDGPASTRFHSVLVGASLTYNPEFIDFTTAPDSGRWAVMYDVKESGTWNHKVIRNDGSGLLNGVVQSSIAGDFAQGSGGVAFDTGVQIANLALFNFWVCDHAAQSFYDWSRAHEMGGYWRFDRSALDLSGQLNGVIGGTPVSAGAQVGSGLLFDGATDEVFIGGQAELSIFNSNGKLTVEGWIRCDSIAGSEDVVIKDSGAAGYLITIAQSLDPGRLSLEFTARFATTNAYAFIDSALDVGTLSYVCIVNDGVNAPAIYIDGWKSPMPLSLSTAPDGAVADDSAVDLRIGNNAAATRGFTGVINEMRISMTDLSDEVRKERFIANSNRRGVPTPQMFAHFPEIPLWGESVGWHIENVIPEIKSEEFQPYVKDGVRVKARRFSTTMDTVQSERGGGFPSADLEIRLKQSQRRSVLSPIVTPIRGRNIPWNIVGIPELNIGKAGPYGWIDNSFAMPGGAAYLSSSSVAPSRMLYGRDKVTVLAWVKRSVTLTDETIFSIADSNLNYRFKLSFNIFDRVDMSYRPTSADTHLFASSPVTVSDTEWHLVGAIMDISGDVGSTIIDGKIVQVDPVPWIATAFSDEGFGSHRIGANVDNTLPFTGNISMVGMWLRALSAGEILSVYEKAKKGFFQ